jgi:hypothetical protein
MIIAFNADMGQEVLRTKILKDIQFLAPNIEHNIFGKLGPLGLFAQNALFGTWHILLIATQVRRRLVDSCCCIFYFERTFSFLGTVFLY